MPNNSFIQSLLAKTEFFVVSLLVIIHTQAIFHFFNFNLIVNITRSTAEFLREKKFSKLKIIEIHRFYFKMKKFFRINSCFKDCICLKIIFSYYGIHVNIIGGVKFNEDRSLDGHAWLRHNEEVLFEDTTKIKSYLKSFII